MITHEEFLSREASIKFMEEVHNKVKNIYVDFDLSVTYHQMGMMEDKQIKDKYDVFKTSVERCKVINSEFIYFN